jgi:hypothetical protein
MTAGPRITAPRLPRRPAARAIGGGDPSQDSQARFYGN